MKKLQPHTRSSGAARVEPGYRMCSHVLCCSGWVSQQHKCLQPLSPMAFCISLSPERKGLRFVMGEAEAGFSPVSLQRKGGEGAYVEKEIEGPRLF